MIDQAKSASFFADMTQFEDMRRKARNNEQAALKEVASQFEAFFLHTILKTMRESNEHFKSDLFSSDQTNFYQQMLDQQMTQEISRQNSLGIAEMFTQQLGKYYTPKEAESAAADKNESYGLPGRVAHEISVSHVVPEEAKVQAGERQATFSDRKEFLQTLLPYAKQVADKIGLDPRMLLAQAALETGWGSKLIHDLQGNNSHNLFGIKASRDWEGPAVSIASLEFDNNQSALKRSLFRKYGSYEDSFGDYMNFLQSHTRYKNTLNSVDNPERFFNELQQAGYATDPAYADKVMRIFHNLELSNK